MSERKLRVFLCHASQDKPIVRELYQRLLAEGWIDPWLDSEKLLPGQDWDMEIRRAIRAADVVIVFFSNQSVLKEGYIQKELRFVLEIADEKPEGIVFAVPIRLDECSVPRRLENWHYLDYFPKDLQNRAYDRLLNTLTLKATFLGIDANTVIEGNLPTARLRALFDDIDIPGTTILLDPQAALNEMANASGRILRARFVFIFILDQSGNFSRTAHVGVAPQLLEYLTKPLDTNLLMQAATNLRQASRILDVTNLDNNITLDEHGLQSLIIIPLRLHRLSIGALFVFGKNGGTSFSEDDELLASYIGIQVCAAIEASWLYSELRNTLNETAIAYQLSQDILQAEGLNDAVHSIVHAVQNVSHADSGGLVLFNDRNEVDISIIFDSDGIRAEPHYPAQLVEQAMKTRQAFIVAVEYFSEVCYPLQTPYRQYGALWLNLSVSRGANFASLQTLASQASISIERFVLIRESRQ